jgi:hypothetical protein
MLLRRIQLFVICYPVPTPLVDVSFLLWSTYPSSSGRRILPPLVDVSFLLWSTYPSSSGRRILPLLSAVLFFSKVSGRGTHGIITSRARPWHGNELRECAVRTA